MTQTIRIAAAVIIRTDGLTLLVRKRGTTAFMQPGGKIEPQESPASALLRELVEEIGLHASLDDLHPLGHFEASAANEAGFTVSADVFLIESGDAHIASSAEIEELRWIDPKKPGDIVMAELTEHHILPAYLQNAPGVSPTRLNYAMACKTSVAGKLGQCANLDAKRFEVLATTEIRQVDDEAGGDDFRTDLAQQLDGANGSTAGRDQVVAEDHFFARLYRIDMDFHLVGTVFQRIGHANRAIGQLALLADRHETSRKLMCHRAAQNEAARFHAGDLVDAHSFVGFDQFIHRQTEGRRITEQRGDIAKDDAGLGIIWNGTDRSGENVFGRGSHDNPVKAIPAKVGTGFASGIA